jgi:hypothetical protein
MSAKILRFQPRRPIARNIARCAGCETHFIPFAPHHRLCKRCFSWHRAGWYLAAAVRALSDAEGRDGNR